MKVLKNQNIEFVLESCQRPTFSSDKIKPIIEEVFSEVSEKGDKALKKFTHYFDKVDLDVFEVTAEEVKTACREVPEDLKNAIKIAKDNIEQFHKSQAVKIEKVMTMPGVSCWQEARPINKIGIYIPGGSAPLFSTVLMLGVPAKIAGCEEIIMCTPPDQNGKINSAILFAAQLCGISKIYKLGGAQAIAAMSIGTSSIPKVFKIFGPGNQYVTAAKMMSQEFGTAIDMPAGPSELMVVADDSAVPAFVASDLLSQAEHGPDSQVICVADSERLIYEIQKEIEVQMLKLPRKEIATAALKNSTFVLSKSLDFSLKIINEYAPEHLIVCLNEPDSFLSRIDSAGSVFIGNYTPESAGDYASGTNHTLPTSGFAKTYSGVNLDAFQKKITFQQITEEGMLNIGSVIEVMAEAEELLAHKNAVSLRLKTLQ